MVSVTELFIVLLAISILLLFTLILSSNMMYSKSQKGVTYGTDLFPISNPGTTGYRSKITLPYGTAQKTFMVSVSSPDQTDQKYNQSVIVTKSWTNNLTSNVRLIYEGFNGADDLRTYLDTDGQEYVTYETSIDYGPLDFVVRQVA